MDHCLIVAFGPITVSVRLGAVLLAKRGAVLTLRSQQSEKTRAWGHTRRQVQYQSDDV